MFSLPTPPAHLTHGIQQHIRIKSNRRACGRAGALSGISVAWKSVGILKWTRATALYQRTVVARQASVWAAGSNNFSFPLWLYAHENIQIHSQVRVCVVKKVKIFRSKKSSFGEFLRESYKKRHEREPSVVRFLCVVCTHFFEFLCFRAQLKTRFRVPPGRFIGKTNFRL